MHRPHVLDTALQLRRQRTPCFDHAQKLGVAGAVRRRLAHDEATDAWRGLPVREIGVKSFSKGEAVLRIGDDLEYFRRLR